MGVLKKSAIMKASLSLVFMLSCFMVSQVTSSPLDTNTNALLAPQEKYDAFFELVDRFLWDSEDDLEERQYYGQRYRRRGWMHEKTKILVSSKSS